MSDDHPADDVIARVAALPPLRNAIGRQRLSARRSLGQHFLLDLNLARRIARAAGPLGTGTTIEVGPGPGGLTRALLIEGAGHVIAVERDPRAIASLRDLGQAAQGRLDVIEGDARRLAFDTLGTAPRRVVANLPYNIATMLIVQWLAAPRALESITVMVQKEVAMRLCAVAGSPDHGRLGILVRWLTEPTLLFEVPASAFTPPPRVTSALVRLVPRPQPLHPAHGATLQRLTAAAFGQRRKMLRASLRPLGGEMLLQEAGIDPQARPETLDVADFCRLARAYDRVATSGAAAKPVDEPVEPGQPAPPAPFSDQD